MPVHLVFDLDGTLSDPLIGIYRCYNHALATLGFPEVNEADVAKLIGPPLDAGFRTLVPGVRPSRVAALVASYRERYATEGFAENTLYDGIADVLNRLQAQGVRMGVCTSKRADFAERILDLFGLRSLFEFVDGGDVGLSKVEQMRALRTANRVGPNSAMIGDRAYDMVAAVKNGMSAIGVLWGYGSREELLDAGAEQILLSVDELAALGSRC